MVAVFVGLVVRRHVLVSTVVIGGVLAFTALVGAAAVHPVRAVLVVALGLGAAAGLVLLSKEARRPVVREVVRGGGESARQAGARDDVVATALALSVFASSVALASMTAVVALWDSVSGNPARGTLITAGVLAVLAGAWWTADRRRRDVAAGVGFVAVAGTGLVALVAGGVVVFDRVGRGLAFVGAAVAAHPWRAAAVVLALVAMAATVGSVVLPRRDELGGRLRIMAVFAAGGVSVIAVGGMAVWLFTTTAGLWVLGGVTAATVGVGCVLAVRRGLLDARRVSVVAGVLALIALAWFAVARLVGR